MNNIITLIITPYGAWTELMSAPVRLELHPSLSSPLKIIDIKQMVLRELLMNNQTNDHISELMHRSVLATDETILRDNDPLPPASALALIPPVGGG